MWARAASGERLRDLDELKRVTYLTGLLVGIPVMVLVAVSEGSDSRVVRVGYPLVMALLLYVGVALLRRRMSVASAERLVLSFVPLLWFGQLLDAMYVTTDLALAQQVVTVSVGPGIVIVVALIYLAADARRGLRSSLALCGAFAAMVLPRALPMLFDPVDGATGLVLVRVVAFTTVMSLLLYVLARLKAEVARHRERADGLDLLAGTDVVTGIANRRRASRVLEEQLQQAQRYDRPLSVALLDLDEFKTINDTEGHAAGDRALLRVVETLDGARRRVDTLARWGGDELLIIAPETRLDELCASADRWRTAVTDQRIRAGDGVLTVSVGVTTRVAGDTVDSLVQRADTALYAAKRTGRDCTMIG